MSATLALRPVGQLGDFRTDLISALDAVPGVDHARAASLVTSAENFIRERARQGAEQAIPTIEEKVRAAVKAQIPTIRAEVKKTVLPLVVGTGAVALAGLALAIVATVRTRKR